MNYAIKLLSAYLVDFPAVTAYMLQQSEYEMRHYIEWLRRTQRFDRVSVRGQFVPTTNSRKVRAMIYVAAGTYWLVSLLTIAVVMHVWWEIVLATLIILSLYPVYVVINTIIFVSMLKVLRAPIRRKRVTRAKAILRSHKGIVVAIAGSYAKTSMKELLQHLLAGSIRFAATEGNKNTLMSQVQFIENLRGNEEVLVVELGEGRPGDIAAMVDVLSPDYAIITGLAPNHLDRYETIEAVADDFRVLADCVGPERTFINADSPELLKHLADAGLGYGLRGFDAWRPNDVVVGVQSVSFSVRHEKRKMLFQVSLAGEHNIGPILLASALALRLGVDEAKLMEKVNAIQPYEHRMQPRDMGGAWMIDDTYNGNIEGMRAGLAYLGTLKVAGRKMYATPGLVDQGRRTEQVHEELGRLIATANPDEVFLMKNSVTNLIRTSMEAAKYNGKVTIIENPLVFYTNIRDLLAKGDLILCQNDWPDSYA